MISVQKTYELMRSDPDNMEIHLMDFVDDFRYYRDTTTMMSPIAIGYDDRTEALLAGVVEYLCDEISVDPPEWTDNIPACKDPYFPHGMENLKAISIVESPLRFRIRKVFVMDNFLSRA